MPDVLIEPVTGSESASEEDVETGGGKWMLLINTQTPTLFIPGEKVPNLLSR